MVITSIYPGNGDTNISRLATIEVTFSAPLDTNTVTKSNVLLTRTDNVFSVPVTLSFSTDKTILYIKPDDILESETTYTVKIIARDYLTNEMITSNSGDPLDSDFVSRFTTGSETATDSSGPMVSEDPMYSELVQPEGYIGKLRFVSSFPRHAVLIDNTIKLEFSKALQTQDLSDIVSVTHGSLVSGELSDIDYTASITDNIITVSVSATNKNSFVHITVADGLMATDGSKLLEPVEVDYFTEIYPSSVNLYELYLRLGNARSKVSETNLYMAVFDAIARLENLTGKNILESDSVSLTRNERSYIFDKALLNIYEMLAGEKDLNSSTSVSMGSVRMDFGSYRGSMLKYLASKLEKQEREFENSTSMSYARRGAKRLILFERDWRTVS